jgi:hypothetical protein
LNEEEMRADKTSELSEGVKELSEITSELSEDVKWTK